MQDSRRCLDSAVKKTNWLIQMSIWNQNINVGGNGTPGRSPVIQMPLSQFSALQSPYSPSYPTKVSTPMETESVRSGHSDRSKRSNHRSPGSTNGTYGPHKGRRSHSHRSNRSDRSPHHHKGETREGDEVIEVQILPQDENWGESILNIIILMIKSLT